ncbi:carbohydrate-binding protein [Paenibacillus rhizovicinus]|uniref:Carbohydrate-binding protein n=1 Tax=Paenibacillus rhizovicinus TaxID=2704463 RepID=A0A6C0P4L4_9BACL|nr:carbohydrate-binding protein [Paenibacillus rhizovicinus]QHW33484.1 carbohydrate-binding protein [Paenibacillus rhizovicinus]
MSQLSIEIHNEDGSVLASAADDVQANLVYGQAYAPGDAIVVKSDEDKVHLMIQLDDAMNPGLVYFSGQEYRLPIPFGEKRISYSPKTFSGEKHVLRVRLATEEERSAYRNLAINEYDHHENQVLYPHAHANVETRGEAVFAARNAINGNVVNDSHGEWPYESWGINQREDAEITVSFGRTVVIDKVVLTLRADFPHDNYWENVTLAFSDGSQEKADLIKTHRPQALSIAPRKVESVTLKNLIKSNDPSPFPALSQIEVFGRELS